MTPATFRFVAQHLNHCAITVLSGRNMKRNGGMKKTKENKMGEVPSKQVVEKECGQSSAEKNLKDKPT